MVKAPILSPTPPSSPSISPTNEHTTVENLTNSETPLTVNTSNNLQIPKIVSNVDNQNESLKKITIRLDEIVMGDSDSELNQQEPAANETIEITENPDELDLNSNKESKDSNNSSSTSSNGNTAKTNEDGDNAAVTLTTSCENQTPTTIVNVVPSQLLTPITIGITQPTVTTTQSIQSTISLPSSQQISQIQASQPPPPSAPPHHHHHHHIFPSYVISIPQGPPGSATAAAVSGTWPLVEAPIYVDSNGEPRHYCPAHSQGPAPRDHCVLLQLDAGVSLPLQIAGKRKVFRGPTTVQMVSQNRPPPIPVPVQVPQGQVMQQYVNESGTLTHVVLSQYPQLHTGQGGVPHIHAPFMTPNGATSHFFGPVTSYPGGGPTHYHPPTMPGAHLPQQMSHSSHSPSPPSNYHKDERTQRQYTKLLRKLDQKRELNSAVSTPAHSPSPRKNDLNGLRRTTRNGASSVGTSEDGEESSSVPDEEDECQALIEQLSAVQKPEVTDITSRSAMLRWEAPFIPENIIINSRDLRYDVLLSDRGKEGKYKIIFKGDSYDCLIQDLRPGQEYFVCLQVHYDKLQGSASEPTVFKTPSCEPDQPLHPKLITRTKNSLQLRWNAPIDNGSHIINYILEYDDGKGKEFIEITKTKSKQYTVTRLQPSTHYKFRLAAINGCGTSAYSSNITYSTSGNPPQTPNPPRIQAATSNSLLLAWDRRAQDEEFVLQMADSDSGHGFLSMYNGIDTTYECKGLKRATGYQFRLRADNEAGCSPWSNDVKGKTQPERPGRPAKPQIKGKIHGTHFKVKWDPPNDRGGADIKKYFLEISSGAKFEKIYSGIENETTCDRLSPGTTYQIRAACEGPGGVSGYSDICTITTEAIVPGAPESPFYSNPPGPYGAVLRWESPDYNGGAPVLEYEVQLNGFEHENLIVYRGKEAYCVIKDLHPGEKYEANVRAVNRIGAGPWSEVFHFSAGAAPPNAPELFEILVRSATHLTISWKEPNKNGSTITGYRLESSDTHETNECFSTCYQGIQTTADIRNLIPFTLYYFRVCAINVAGSSPFSVIVSKETPAAVPSAPQIDNYEITSNEVKLQWSEPEANGSDILYYIIEYADEVITTDGNVTEYKIGNLSSETSYKFKVQAVNGIGTGPHSVAIKLTTLPPPPEPPILECTGIGHNYLKLKWGEGRNIDFTCYYIEMYNNRAKEYQIVYKGTSFMCKVNKLQEQTSYRFRVYAETDKAGVGDYSIEYVFKTCATLPNNIKAPRIMDINSITTSAINAQYNNLSTGITGPQHNLSSNVITVEWQHSKNTFTDPIEYILQCCCNKENDYEVIYRGPDTHYSIENLEPGTIYLFRVCPIRVTSNGDLMGVYTTSLRYQVPSHHRTSFDVIDAAQLTTSSTNLIHLRSITSGISSDVAINADDMTNSASGSIRRIVSKVTSIYTNRRRFSDQEKAILWMVFFIVATICFAVLVRMFMR